MKENDVRLMVLLGNKKDASFNADDLGIIDEYIERHYYLAKKIDYFYVYLKK